MNTPLLDARGLDVAIGGKRVCSELELTLRGGQRLAILGRNGIGKSTLLATLAGLRQPGAGQVLLADRSYADLGPRGAALIRGWLGQQHGDPFASSVLEAVLAGRHPHLGRWQWESAADLAIARDALCSVDLAGFEARQSATLSGGERQRLALATLLAQAPRLYLLDEPLAHLDLHHQIAVLELMASQTRDQNVACVMVLHDPGLAARYCDHALLLLGDGEWLAGASEDVITTDNLSRLYAHPLRELRDGAQRWFVPS